MTSDAPDDRELLLRIQKGRLSPPVDQEAETTYFTRLSHDFQDKIRRMTRHEADAEDLMQEGQVRIIENIKSYKPILDRVPGAWGHTVLRNSVLNGLKRLRRTSREGDEYRDVADSDGPASIDASIGGAPMSASSMSQTEREVGAWLGDALIERLYAIRSPYVRCFLMYWHEDLADDVVADTLGYAKGSIRGYRERGRKLLAAVVSDYREEFNRKQGDAKGDKS